MAQLYRICPVHHNLVRFSPKVLRMSWVWGLTLGRARLISGSGGSCLPSLPSYCSDLKKKQIISVPHPGHPEYQKLLVDGIISQKHTEKI